MLNTLLTLYYLIGGIVFSLMGKLKFREAGDFTQDHVAIKWQSQPFCHGCLPSLCS